MRNKLSLMILILISISLFSLNENTGTNGFSFLKVQYSARASAMANAFSGLADNADAVFYNPAGLVQVRSSAFSTTYMNYFDGINTGSLVVSFPKHKKRSLAFFAKFLSTKLTRELQDNNGNYIGSDGTFGVSDIIFGICDSRFINKSLNLGVNIKYIRESLDETSASAIALDFGLLHQTANKFIKVGVSVRNIGGQLTYYTDDKHKEGLPSSVNIGFSYHPDEKFYALVDINKPFDNDFSGKVGLEYRLHRLFFLRTGYKTNATDWKLGGDNETFSGLSFGVGFNWHRYSIDYAISSYGDLGYLNQISLSYSFK